MNMASGRVQELRNLAGPVGIRFSQVRSGPKELNPRATLGWIFGAFVYCVETANDTAIVAMECE